ncbi:PAS domain S-box-containing protein [Pseudoduganella lurida]|uniref:histidine kinase n=1 Tax=Pseudoduganella lurida TaxID=1036180 RepID=A0A562RL40_9BURK|nr:ATP-binding protein [Pseudoduganella lurida]TWI69767.1 PAS domain S-box-containing protein [Pseudoduganella lurida]
MSPNDRQTNLSNDVSWLSGGGEAGALIQTIDWSKTPLGPLHAWPQSLRTTVSLCLSSTFPILVAWGPEYIQIYNDAYRPICGGKHPASMGEPFKVCWATALPVVGDKFDRAQQGEGTYIKDQRMFLDRYGYLEEAFMTFSFSPIRAESGDVGGIFHPITETTALVLNARRTQSLRDLSAAIDGARTVQDIGRQFAAQYEGFALDLPFLLFYQLDGETGEVHLRGSAGIAVGHALAPVAATLDDAAWPFARAAASRETQQVDGLAQRFGTTVCGPYEEPPASALVLPLTLPGQQQPFGFLVAGVSARRALDADYRNFYALLNAAFNTAVGDVTAYAQEQQRVEELARIDRAKTAFFSNVSHEFRTPLTLILGPLDDALAADGLAPPQRRRIETTHRNALRLLKLVNSLLDFSRIEAGRVQATYSPVDLARLSTDIASVFESAMEKGGLAYTLDLRELGQPVYVDRDMWEKILLNLLSNAFKFTLAGGVTVTLREHDGMARLSVADTGGGIPAEELPRVFERFHRIEGAAGRSLEGSGIGLALIQELVRLHGGSIAVSSTPGEGTRFDVDIPFGHAHLPEDRIAVIEGGVPRMGAAFLEEALRWLPDAPAIAPPAPLDGGSPLQPEVARPRILIADDNSDMRAYLKSLLEPHADVVVCGDGEAAFEALLRDPPDVLLSDVMMPRLDGFGLIARIRATEAVRELPVILLSARAGEEAKVEGLQAGADDYLVKPFSTSELLARVQRQVALGRQRRQHKLDAALRDSYVRSVIDTSPAMLWITDVDGQCTYLSERWYERTGRTPEQDMGLGWLENIHPDDYAFTRDAFLTASATRTPFSVDYRLRQRDGSYRWAVDSGMPHTNEAGEPTGYVGTVIDIHERVVAQEAAQRLAGELTEKNRLQSEFLFTLAHELRNPLAPIRAGLEVMRRDPAGTSSGQVQRVMTRQVEHMVHLVDDLLDMARLTEGKVTLRSEPVLLADVVNDAVEMSMPLVEAGRHALTVQLPPEPVTLTIDRHRIAQVLSNLVNNAAKYTPGGGRIAVAARIDGNEVALAVADNGIGIEAEQLSTVFDLYAQVPAGEAMAQGGLGVGLNLVRRLVQLHGGRVAAESDGAGQGSRFTIWLPLSAQEHAPAQDAAPAEATMGHEAAGMTRGLEILVVDDNEDAAKMLCALLEFSGHAVTLAHDGAGALAAAAARPPQVVFLDIGLPDISGYEAAGALRRLDGMGAARLIALTGWGAEADKQRSRAAGFDYHLTKPADFTQVQQILNGIAAQLG